MRYKKAKFFGNHVKYMIIFHLLIIAVIFNSKSIFANQNHFLENNYQKKEYRIPMRDGKKLFTAVYSPKNISSSYPILLWRTPYSAGPYGEDKYVTFRRETWHHFAKEGYIIVFQDVRGRFMSEGEYVNMRPYTLNKEDRNDVDESSDTYDTIDWLVKNIPNNNGKVGMWGISYPGFYAAMGAIDAHPALKAVSPQGPIADWFVGDDLHHNGAFALAQIFPGIFWFRIERSGLTTEWPESFRFPTPDGYHFYLEMGALLNANLKYIQNKSQYWNNIMIHGTYDKYWKSRNLLPNLRNIQPAMMIVGGWFDAENLYGTLQTYQAIEKYNPNSYNILVMGPWYHGGWVRSDGSKLGNISFEEKTGTFFVKNIELPFFNHFLKGNRNLNLPEAYVFETGSNLWKTYRKWPPKSIRRKKLYLHRNHSISYKKPVLEGNFFHEFVSGPAKPVPFTAEITTGIPKSYMVEDQRFSASRPDVLVYQSTNIKKEGTIVGPIEVDLYVSTTGTDSDWVVKVIDCFPDNLPTTEKVVMGGYQMLIRADIMRGKFRNSLEIPQPMNPNTVSRIRFTLNDVNHKFKKGHRIMIHIQSSWFPLFDRNPQKYIDIYSAKDNDFQKAIHRVYLSWKYPSCIIVNFLDEK